MEYYAAIKNNEFMFFLMKLIEKWTYLEDIILSEVTQSKKNTHDMHSLIRSCPEAQNPSYKGEQNTHRKSYRDYVQSRD